MADNWSGSSPAQTPASTPRFLTTLAIVLASTGALLVFDLWLARIDTRESRMHAVHLFDDGESLLTAKQPKEAADRFASAQALERNNVSYGVALAEALLADGRVNEAEAQLRSVLGRVETDGPANLVMARILARQGRPDDAAAFYHRAIYGSWHTDTLAWPLRARLELIDLLVRRDAKRELLAELLPLQDIQADSVRLRRRLGHLFVLAGSPERALPLFRGLLKQDPDDGDAYAGMGEAALQLGNFRTARADLLQATRLLPDSVRYASMLQVADTVLALDPRARGIGRAGRYERSRAVLQLTVNTTVGCRQDATTRTLLDSARVMLAPSRLVGADRDVEDSDPLLDLASDLWARRDPRCPLDGSPATRALQFIQDELS